MLIALITDSHLSPRAPELVANWQATAAAVAASGAELTLHLGDITLDGQRWPEELDFARRCIESWPTPMRCVPGNHDVGHGCGEAALDAAQLQRYRAQIGPDRWSILADGWLLLGLNAQLLGSGSAEEAEQWQWLEAHAAQAGDRAVALLLHRPLAWPVPQEAARSGRYVPAAARQRLLAGPLQGRLALVVSGHTHQHLNWQQSGVRHCWLPSTAFVLPDSMQPRVGEKLVGFGLLRLDGAAAALDLHVPDALQRHDFTHLPAARLFAGIHTSKESE